MNKLYYILLAIGVCFFFINYLSKRKRKKLFNLAYNMTLNGHIINAIKVYDRLIRLSPKNFIYFNNRGHCYLLLEDIEHARSDFNKSLELESDPLDNHICYENIERLEALLKK